VRHAAFLFDEGVESIKTVAMLSGFSDALYFSRIFRQDIGITPTEYIRQVRKNRA
jgi:AraC-like DNA-binding protein